MTTVPEGMKECRLCWAVKPLSEFYTQRTAKGYVAVKYCCKACNAVAVKRLYHANPLVRAKVKARAAAHTKAKYQRGTPEYRRLHNLKSKFGLSEADYEAMRLSQGNRCAICQSADTGRKSGKWARGHWHVDHCHETGRIRGLVCHACNVRLGAYERLLKDRGYDWLQAYLAGP